MNPLYGIFFIIVGIIIIILGISKFRNPPHSLNKQDFTGKGYSWVEFRILAKTEKEVRIISVIFIIIGILTIVSGVLLILIPDIWLNLITIILMLSSAYLIFGGYIIFNPTLMYLSRYGRVHVIKRKLGIFLVSSGVAFLILSILIFYLMPLLK